MKYICYSDASYFQESDKDKKSVIAYIMKDESGNVIFNTSKRIQASSSFVAEFKALRSLVSRIIHFQRTHKSKFIKSSIEVYSDNLHLVEYVKAENMPKGLSTGEWYGLMGCLNKNNNIDITWIPRELNIADELIRKKVDEEEIKEALELRRRNLKMSVKNLNLVPLEEVVEDNENRIENNENLIEEPKLKSEEVKEEIIITIKKHGNIVGEFKLLDKIGNIKIEGSNFKVSI